MNAFNVKCNTGLEWFNLLVIFRITTLKKNLFWLPQDYKASLEKLDKPWTIPKSTHNVIRFTWLKQKKRNFLVILKQTFLDKKVKATWKQHNYSEFFWSIISHIWPLRIQSECGRIRTRKTPNTDTFHAVLSKNEVLAWQLFQDTEVQKKPFADACQNRYS